MAAPGPLKLAIFEDYQERSFLEEVQRALELESYVVFARLNHADIVDLEVPGDQRLRFVGFVEDWIDGFSLQEFLRRPDSDVSSSFLVSYVARPYLSFVCAADYGTEARRPSCRQRHDFGTDRGRSHCRVQDQDNRHGKP